MRFHHSTRRGRNRLSAAHGFNGSSSASSNARARKLRWSQLSYCRQSNIHFNRRLPVEPPPSLVDMDPALPGDSCDRCAHGAVLAVTADARAKGEIEQLISKNSFARCTCAPNHRHTDPSGELSARLNGLCLQCPEPAASEVDIITGQPVATQVQAAGEQELAQQQARAAATDEVCYCEFCNPSTSQQDNQQAGAGPTPPSSATTTADDSSRATMVASNVIFNRAQSQQTDPGGKQQCCRNLQRPTDPQKPIRQQGADRIESSIKDETSSETSKLASHKHTGVARASSMDLASAREKLLAQVEKKPFWSNKAARRMQLSAPEERRVYLYELISFCERRELEWRFEPYSGRLTHGSTPFRRLPMGSIVVAPAGTLHQPTGLSPLIPSPPPPPVQLVAGSPAPKSPARSSPDDDDDYNQQFTPRHRQSPAKHQQSANYNNQSPQIASPISQASNRSIIDTHAITTGEQQLSPLQAGGAVAPEQGAMPSAEVVWSIEAPPKSRPDDFVGSIYTCEVPETSFVKRCHGCAGKGRLKCNSCYGVGYEVCISCSGRGTTRSWLSRSAADRYASLSAAGSAVGGSGGGGISGGRSSRAPTSMDPKDSHSDHSHDHSTSRKLRIRAEQKTGGGITGATASHASPWQTESCSYCHGAGQKRCWTCAGRAYLTCTGCAGAGQVRCYLQLSITWLNHRDELLLNNNDSILPRDRLRLASGYLLIDEIGSPRLSPLNEKDVLSKLELPATDGATDLVPEVHNHTDKAASYKYNSTNLGSTTSNSRSGHQRNSKNDPLQQVAAIQAASARMIERHKTSFKGERFIKQRQKLTQIECFIVRYDWKRRQGHFVIYGNERKVYIGKYPFKSICNIT